MQYVRIENNLPVDSMLTRQQLAQLLPANMSFPTEIPADMLAEYGFAPAQAMQPPTVGLLESARQDGYKLVDGVWYQTWAIDRVASLEEAQAIAIAALEAFAKSKRDAVVNAHSVTEIAAWSLKCREAETYRVTQDPAWAPSLSDEAEVRGVPLVELVAKVLAKARLLSQLETRIADTCSRKRYAVRACETVEAVQTLAEQAEDGWPV